MPAKSLTVVVPVFNEGDALADNLRMILAHARTAADAVAARLLVINDGSTDETVEVIARLAKLEPDVDYLTLNRNFGKEAAIRAGLDHAGGDAVIVMDGDLQHPPELIPQMVRLWLAGAAVVEAYKAGTELRSCLYRLFARLFYALFERLSGFDLRHHSDYKLLDARVVQAYRALPEHARFFRGLVAWMHFSSARVPFKVSDRRSGRSRWSPIRLLGYSIDTLTSFSSMPLQLVTWLGLFFFGLGVLLGGKALYDKISGQALDGFTTVILLLVIVGSTLMLSLGLLGSYVGRIYDEVKGRPSYLVDLEHTRLRQVGTTEAERGTPSSR